ncbi:hypothetical protein [Terribacillus saccharophilus]|uniref:hypothetical protein n=1 Tax=Terribacillus saccharophilus TaxID=361277 RepID=UPI002989F5CB|nr:hypothetical protein [Terribacillus saccharophilus]MCM3227510.1 hypothetical protein [Terribacillus saccharophilus]
METTIFVIASIILVLSLASLIWHTVSLFMTPNKENRDIIYNRMKTFNLISLCILVAMYGVSIFLT